MDKSQPNLFVFPNVDALAPALRAYIIQSQTAGIARHGAFKLAVSGGSLPKTLSTALLALPSGPNDQVTSQRHSLLGSSIESVQLLKKLIRGGRVTPRGVMLEQQGQLEPKAGSREW